MLEIVFLGTSSSIPSKNRNPSAIWLRYEGDSFLFDCGEGTQRQLMIAKLSFMTIERIFITHWHADHWAGLIGLMQTMSMEKRKKSLYIYGPDGEMFVADILDLDYWGPRFPIIPKDVPYEGNELTTILKKGKYEMLSIPTRHSVPSAAYCFRERDTWNVDMDKATKLYGLRQDPLVGRLKEKGKIVLRGKKITLKDVGSLKKGIKVVYTGDTEPCPNLEIISKEADLLIHDATFLDEMEDRMHSGVKQAATLAKKSGVKKLLLTHFSRRYQDLNPLKEEAQKIFKQTELAEDFMRITFNK